MTIGLSYLGDLSRVRIALTDLADGTVKVEHSAQASFNVAATVRGGEALLISSGVGQLDWYEFYADVLNHFRVVPIDPPAGLLLPGADGDYASTPDHASLNVTGDLDVRADATRESWRPASDEGILGKYESTGDLRQYRFELRAAGTLRLRWSTNGTSLSTEDSTVAVPDVAGRLAMRAKLDVDNGGVYQVVFETAPTSAGPWTQLGDPKNGAATTSIFGAGTAPLEVGAYDGGFATFEGNIHSAEVRDGIDGTLVADPDFAAQAGGATSFADAAGRTWTVQGDAQVVGIETASITPSLAGQVWLKSVRYPLLNRVVTVADYGEVESPSRSVAFPVAGRSLPTGIGELHGGRNHLLVIASESPAEFAHLDLMSRVGGFFFVHVPTQAVSGLEGNLLLPGSMHVLLGTPRVVRLGGITRFQHIQLPLVEVNPPGPDVIGGTLTWQTIQRLYGSWTAVWAAHSSWRSIWDTIGSPEDVFVP